MAISRRVQGIKAEGRTALYETVLKSSKAILELSALAHMAAAAEEGASTGRFTLVVLTDGADTSEDRDEKLEQLKAEHAAKGSPPLSRRTRQKVGISWHTEGLEICRMTRRPRGVAHCYHQRSAVPESRQLEKSA